MTYNGYYFAAPGSSEYAFFHGERNMLSVSHAALPDAPIQVRASSGAAYTITRPCGWFDEDPAPGASFPFLDPDGSEAGRLYLLGADHFAVAVPGAALNGRVIH